MATNTYTLHEYDHRFDAGLAQMWNESDEQWPGTFTDGVPLTEERIADWMDRVEVIIRFIAVEDQTGKVVGYGDLWNRPIRPKSCYVALLNVHPEHQGHSIARRMLVRMVDWAAEHGYDRITIGTWPANLKAMPLYKKVGFFWKPGSSVYMENYLTAARLLPAARPYFDRHGWYETYRRDLSQVEDDQTHPATGETKVYILRWEADGERLETVFDRNAQALTGIETNDWAAYARTGSAEPAQGFRYPFEWEFRNNSDRPLPVRMQACPDEGIALVQQAAFVLQPGESRVLASDFVVAADAPKYDGDHDDVVTPQVRTELEIDGVPVRLGTGLRYSQAVSFSAHPAELSLVPGVPQTVNVQVHNRTKDPLSGMILVEAEGAGLQAGWTAAAFVAPAEGFAGLPLTLTAAQAGFAPLILRAALDQAGGTTTPPKRFPVTVLEPGRVAAGLADDELVLENDFFRIRTKSKSGESVIFNKDSGEEDGRLMEEIGPAFVPWDLNEQHYAFELQAGEHEARATMTVRSTRFPGLVVGREISVNASPLIRVRGWVRNETDQAHAGLQLRPHLRIAHENRHLITVPLQERTVQAHGSQFAIAEDDLPKQPERYAEQWLSYEEQGRAFGLIWPPAGIDEFDSEWGRHFVYYALPLEAGQTRWSEPLHVYSGPGDWRAVQRAWRRLRGLPRETARPALPYLDIGLGAEPLATLGTAIDARLALRSTRQYVLSGTVTVEPPPGWHAEPHQAEFILDSSRPFDLPIRLEAGGAAPGAAAGQLRFRSQLFDHSQPFTVIRLGDEAGTVTVQTLAEAGQPLWEVANGYSRWLVAPQFHGGVTSWYDRDSAANQLLSAFPEEGELSWMKPFFGGIRPVLHDPDAHGGWPGKLHEERFEAGPVEPQSGADLPWAGVRLWAEVAAKKFLGMRIELDYLTLPGSNVLRTVYRLFNDTPVYRKAEIGWLAFIQVDGSSAESVLHTPDYSRKRTPHSTWGVGRRWAAVENPGTGRALVSLHPSGKQELQAIDMGAFGAHSFVRETVEAPPRGSVELSAFYVLAGDMREARAYSALAGK